MELKKNLALRVRDEAFKSRTIARLVSRHFYWLGGFYTSEIRAGRAREGYLLRSLSGGSGIMASKTAVSPVSFNKYAIDVGVLDGLAADSLAEARKKGKIALIDELGPITLRSEKLASAVLEILASDTPCVAAFRGNAGGYEDTFARMGNTSIIDLEEGRKSEEALDEWMEFWIKKLRS